VATTLEPPRTTTSQTDDENTSCFTTEASHWTSNPLELTFVIVIAILFVLNISQLIAIIYFLRRNKMLEKGNKDEISLNGIPFQQVNEEMEINDMYGKGIGEIDLVVYAEIEEI